MPRAADSLVDTSRGRSPTRRGLGAVSGAPTRTLAVQPVHAPTEHVQGPGSEVVDDTGTSHLYICGVSEMVVEPKELLPDLKEAEG